MLCGAICFQHYGKIKAMRIYRKPIVLPIFTGSLEKSHNSLSKTVAYPRKHVGRRQLMKFFINLLAIFGGLLFFASAVLAEEKDAPIPNLPSDGQTVTISGMVDTIESKHAFMLRNDKGLIEVRTASGSEPLVIQKAENVTVTGVVEKPLWGILGDDIAATQVQAR
jgi:hypothetical protein